MSRPMVHSKTRSASIAALALAVVLAAASPARAGGVAIGDDAPAFTLKPVDKGDAVALGTLAHAKGSKGVVLIFLSARCPYVAQARQPIAELAKRHGATFKFVGLNANQNEAADEIKADAAANFAFPMLRDEGSKVADLYGAEHTPEVFVVDPAGKLRYHGGVADLGAALDALGAGKPVAKPEAKAFGCTIKRKP